MGHRSKFYAYLRIEVQLVASHDFHEAAEHAIETAGHFDCVIAYEFNGIPIEVHPSTDLELLYERYQARINEKSRVITA